MRFTCLPWRRNGGVLYSRRYPNDLRRGANETALNSRVLATMGEAGEPPFSPATLLRIRGRVPGRFHGAGSSKSMTIVYGAG